MNQQLTNAVVKKLKSIKEYSLLLSYTSELGIKKKEIKSMSVEELRKFLIQKTVEG